MMPPGMAPHALGDDRVGERLEAGGDVALGLAAATGGTRRSRRWRGRGRRRRRARPGRRSRRRARRTPPTRVWKVVSGPSIESAAAATSSFWVDAPISGVSAPWVASTWLPALTTKHVPSPGAAASRADWRCWVPTASTTGSGNRRTDHSGVATAAPGVAWASFPELPLVNATTSTTTAATISAPATSARRPHQTAVSRSVQYSSRSTRLSSLPESVRGSSSRTS